MLDIVLSFPAPSATTTIEKFLYVWGNNNSGELGDPSLVNTAQSWSSISSGRWHATAIRNDGTLWTWGYHRNLGLLGLNTTTNYFSPVQIGSDSWTSVATGDSHTVAIRSDGGLFAWGANGSGQLGLNDTITYSSPVQVGTSSWTMVHANLFTSAAIDTAGRLFLWGNNSTYNLGLTDTTNRSSPVAITGSWTTVSVGASHTTGIRSDGKLFVWGSNGSSQLAQPATATLKWRALESAYGSTFGITSVTSTLGYLYAWGLNDQGQLGLGDTTNRSSPVQVGSDFYSTLSVGNKHVFAYYPMNAQFYVWGLNSSGQLGLGDTTNRSVPTAFGSVGEWLSNGVAAGNGFTFLLSASPNINAGGSGGKPNRLFVTGSGTNRANGLAGDSTSSPVMVQESGIIHATVEGQNVYSMILKENGEVWTLKNVSPALFASNFKQISAGRNHTLGIKNDGTLWAWSLNLQNSDGQLGDGTTVGTGKSSPIQIGTGNSWVSVSAGNLNSAAIRSDGALFVWGRNTTYGPLGLNDKTNRSSPVQLGTRSWAAISISDSTLAIDSAGALWAWGNNSSGQLGLANTTSISSPVQVGSDKWLSVATVNLTSAAIRADGGLFTWGKNSDGILGDGTTTDRSSPVQVGTGSWVQISIGGGNPSVVTALGIDSSGYAWAWGKNSIGELGLGDTVSRSSPVQIGTRKYKFAKAPFVPGDYYNCLIDEYNRLWAMGGGVARAYTEDRVYTTPTPNINTYNESWTAISTATSHSVGIRGGNLYTWGTSELNRNQPSVGGTIDYWKHVDAGDLQFLGVKNDGTVWYSNKDSPVLIKFDTGPLNFKKVMQHNAAYIGITEEGALYSWGTNNFGQLGLNDASTPTTPTRIGADKWRDFSIGGTEHTSNNRYTSGTGFGAVLAIRADGALFGWGNNVVGQLGLGDTTNRSSPTQIGTDSWISVGTMGISAAVRSDGGLFTWGKPGTGTSTTYGNRLADGTTTARSSPVQVGTDSWTAVYIGAAHSAAIRTDGSLYMWGCGKGGGLGDGNAYPYPSTPLNSPVLVSGGHTWKHVSLGQSNPRYSLVDFETHTIGTKTDGTMWAWGGRSVVPHFPVSSTTPVQITSFAAIGTQPTMKFASATRTHSTYGRPSMGLYLSESGVLWFTTQARATGREIEWALTATEPDISNPVIFGAFPAQSRPEGNYVPTPTRAYIGKNDNSSANSSNWLDGPRLDSVPTFTRAYTSKWQSFAIDSVGSLWGWGQSEYGQLLRNARTRRFVPQLLDDTKSWSMVGAFTARSTTDVNSIYTAVNGLTTDGKLWKWGYFYTPYYTGDDSGSYGQNITSPIQIGASSWTIVSTRFTDVANPRWAVGSDKIGYYWGYNISGSFGDGTSSGSTATATGLVGTVPTSVSSPVQLGTASWSAIASGFNHTIGVRTDGTLWSWGDNTNGKLGLNDTTARSTVTQVGTDTDWQKVSAGRHANYLIKTNSTAYHMGAGSYGQGAQGNTTANSNPTQISGSWTIIRQNALDINAKHTFGIKSDGLLYGWGWLESYGLSGNINDTGQLISGNAYWLPNLVGGNLTSTQTSPVKLGTETWQSASTGANHTLAIRSDGTLYAWGVNSSGQLGDGTSAVKSSPVQVGTSSWTAVSAGDAHSMAIRSDGGLFVWGNNGTGRLGDGTTTSRSSPVQIGTSSWTAVAAGGSHSVAVRKDGGLFAWGLNNIGQLGQANTTNLSSPVQVGTSSWTAVAAGSSHTAAIKSDGTLFAWGKNDSTQVAGPADIASFAAIGVQYDTIHVITTSGRLWGWSMFNSYNNLGLPITTTDRYSPNLIGTDSDWSKIISGQYQAFAIKTNGTLWGWGNNAAGQLGLGDTLSVSTPTQVPGSWSIVSISEGASTGSAIGIKSDGTLWTWGKNHKGQLGHNDTTDRLTPVQVGTDTDWIQVGSSDAANMAIKSDGTLWGMGYGVALGIGISSTSTNRSSPVQIGSSLGKSFTAVCGGAIGCMAALASTGELYYSGFTQTINNVNFQYTLSKLGTDSWTAIGYVGRLLLGIQPDGALYAWGRTQFGSIGNNTSSSNSPVQLAVGVSFTAVPKGHNAFTHFGVNGAITSTGKLYAWSNYNNLPMDGNLASSGTPAENTTITGPQPASYSSPVAVAGGGSWTAITAGNQHTAGIKTNSGLYTWGRNNYGQLGLGTTTNADAPTQVGSGSWTAVDAGTWHTVGVRSTGDLYAWGYNANGQLGDGTITTRSSPVQVGSDTDHLTASAGGAQTVTLKTI
jgi:alpha-tubulin suppressor-like RCC1 family protein